MLESRGQLAVPESAFQALWALATRQFALGEHSDHGPKHWRCVERNAVRIVTGANAGDLTVVRLFAVLHDSKRENEYEDPEHGQRAADWARRLRGEHVELEEARFEQLIEALIFHDKGRTSDDPTIGACWDADRLDLPRVGITPDARFMSTAFARALLARGRRLGNLS